MKSSFNQRIVERVAQRHGIGSSYNSKQQQRSLNDDLIRMINDIRELEDDLISEQYKGEILKRENQEFQGIIHHLQQKMNKMQHNIRNYSQEIQIQSIKNKQLINYEDNLHAIQQEIAALKQIIQKKEDEKIQINKEIIKKESQNMKINQENIKMRENHRRVQEIFEDILEKHNILPQSTHPQSIHPQSIHPSLLVIKKAVEGYQLELGLKKQEHQRSKKEQANELLAEKQKLIKLEFEYKLLHERTDDDERAEELMQTQCNVENLEKTIEELLLREDQLLEQLKNSQDQQVQIQDSYQQKIKLIQKAQDEIQFDKNSEIQLIHQKVIEIKNKCQKTNKQLEVASLKYQTFVEDKQSYEKIDLNMLALRKLREVQQKNKLLKYKIEQAENTKALLELERQIIHSSQ